VPYSTIHSWIRMGRRVVDGDIFHPDEVVREARALFARGERAEIVALTLHVNLGTLYGWLRGQRAEAGGPLAPTVKS
jgi:hypothetical protein